MRIGLGEDARDSERAGRQQHGPAVAAAAEHGVRAPAAQDAHAGGGRGDVQRERPSEVERGPPWQSAHGERIERVSPAARTSSASARSGVPANVTSAPARTSSSATASAGITCPAVPPAATSTRRVVTSPGGAARAQRRRSPGALPPVVV